MNGSPERRCLTLGARSRRSRTRARAAPCRRRGCTPRRRDQLVDEVLVVAFGVDDCHELSVLRPSAGESPPQECPSGQRTLLPCPFQPPSRAKAAASPGSSSSWTRPRVAPGSRRAERLAELRAGVALGYAARGSSSGAPAEQRPEAADSRAGGGRRRRARARRRSARASGVHAASPRLPELAEPLAQLLVARGRVEEPADDELRRRRSRSSGSPSAGRRRRSARPLDAVELRRRGRTRSRCRRRGRPGGRGSEGACPRRRRRARPPRTRATSSVTSGLPSPNGASRSSSVARLERQRRPRARSRRPGSRERDRRPSSTASAWAANASANASTLLRPDREAGSGAMAAEALEVLRARGERAVQVERRQ